jgi:hypothetical protein
MTEDAGWIAAALALAFVINLVPAFMPSTWMLLTFFYIRYDVPLLPLTIGGAIVSGLGRLVLARASAWFSRRFMTARRDDLDLLGEYLDRNRHVAAPATFLYTLTPLPTNNLFIAAGMVGVNLVWVLAGFWAGRVLADTFWVWTTERVFDSLDDVFEGAVGTRWAIALQSLSVVSVLLLYLAPWARWIRRYANHHAGMGNRAD